MADLERRVDLPPQLKRVLAHVSVTTSSIDLSIGRGDDGAVHTLRVLNKLPHAVDVVAIGRLDPMDAPNAALVDLAAFLALRASTPQSELRLSYSTESEQDLWPVPLTQALTRTPYSPAADFWHTGDDCANGRTHTVALELRLCGTWPKAVPVNKRIDIAIQCHVPSSQLAASAS